MRRRGWGVSSNQCVGRAEIRISTRQTRQCRILKLRRWRSRGRVVRRSKIPSHRSRIDDLGLLNIRSCSNIAVSRLAGGNYRRTDTDDRQYIPGNRRDVRIRTQVRNRQSSGRVERKCHASSGRRDWRQSIERDRLTCLSDIRGQTGRLSDRIVACIGTGNRNCGGDRLRGSDIHIRKSPNAGENSDEVRRNNSDQSCPEMVAPVVLLKTLLSATAPEIVRAFAVMSAESIG